MGLQINLKDYVGMDNRNCLLTLAYNKKGIECENNGVYDVGLLWYINMSAFTVDIVKVVH